MAETDSTVSGTVTFETDDDLSETNIGAAAAQGNRVDYVERGCGFSVNHTNDTITIGSTGTRANYAIVENPSSHVAWHLYPDQDTDIALPNASATNHVFIAYDESSDAISYHIDDDDSAPSEPSLKIGTVDTSADTSTETNRDPTITADALNGGIVGSNPVEKIYGERLDSRSPSGASTVEFDSGVTGVDFATYDKYKIELSDVVPATDGVNVQLQISTDGGGNWKAGTNYDVAVFGIGTSTAFASNNATGQPDINMTVLSGVNVGSAAGEGVSGTVVLNNPSNGNLQQTIRFALEFLDDGGEMWVVHGAGHYTAAEAYDGIRFRFSSGDIESGDLDLYGLMD